MKFLFIGLLGFLFGLSVMGVGRVLEHLRIHADPLTAGVLGVAAAIGAAFGLAIFFHK